MRKARTLTLAAVTFGLVGCGGISYRTDYNPNANFSGLRTYRWVEKVPAENKDPQIYNAIVEGRVKTAVDRALQAKGYREVTSNPDFDVAWHASIEQKQSLRTVGTDYGWGYGWYGPGWGGMGMTSSTTYVDEWDEGTVVVGVFDPQTNDMIWWGSAQAELDQKRSPEEAQERADKAAVKLFEDFPPGSKGS
jgi:hypothetical protein